MTKEEAVASIKTLCNTCELFPKCVNEKPECFKAIELAISALQAQGVPDTNVGDMISRQAAIDAIFGRSHDIIKARLKNLPSVQPEIIRCKDCKYYTPVTARCEVRGKGLYLIRNMEDFCSRAEPYKGEQE